MRARPCCEGVRRATSVPQRGGIGHHRPAPDTIAELAFRKFTLVREAPRSDSQAENAGSIPVTRSQVSAANDLVDGLAGSLPAKCHPCSGPDPELCLQRAYKEGRKDRDEDDERRCGGWSNVGALRFADARRDA